MREIRVLLIDDHEIVREGLASLLAKEEDIHLVAAVATGEEGLHFVEELHPEVAVVDYSLRGISGVEACERIRAVAPDTAVVILTTYLQDEVVLGAVQAGAAAYVVKDVEGEQLKTTIRNVAAGKSVLDPQVAGRVMDWARSAPRTKGSLSRREIEVLRRVAVGRTNDEIAQDLSLSIATIKTYISRVLDKLDCRTRSEAAARAAKWGLI